MNKELLLLAAAGCWGRAMTVPNLLFVDEADDDDDPEYNFLEDLDEPDTEDFRNDRAVRITSKFPSNSHSFLGKLVLLQGFLQWRILNKDLHVGLTSFVLWEYMEGSQVQHSLKNNI